VGEVLSPQGDGGEDGGWIIARAGVVVCKCVHNYGGSSGEDVMEPWSGILAHGLVEALLDVQEYLAAKLLELLLVDHALEIALRLALDELL